MFVTWSYVNKTDLIWFNNVHAQTSLTANVFRFYRSHESVVFSQVMLKTVLHSSTYLELILAWREHLRTSKVFFSPISKPETPLHWEVFITHALTCFISFHILSIHSCYSILFSETNQICWEYFACLLFGMFFRTIFILLYFLITTLIL